MVNPKPHHNITGLVLAGGAGSRMGGCAKGLQAFGTGTLLQAVLTRLQGQVGQIAINANTEQAAHAAYGYPVWPDQQSELLGPLAGLATGLAHCNTEFLLTVPCDSPFFPLDLASRMLAQMHSGEFDVVSVKTREADGRWQTHPVFCLLRPSLAPHVQAYLSAGGRKFADCWQDLRVAFVEYNEGDAFRNLNTRQELLSAATEQSS